MHSFIMTSQNFSSRFGRAYGLPSSTIMGQYGNTVSPGQFVRHGSDERSSGSHRRQNRSRERTAGRTQSQPTLELRTGPAGVQERQEWMEALADVKERVTTLERNDRAKAGNIFRIESAVTEIADKVLSMDKDIVAYKAYLTGIIFENSNSIRHVCDNLEAKIENVTNMTSELLAVRASFVDSKLDTLERAYVELQQHLQQTTTNFNISTPTQAQPPDPTGNHRGSNDPNLQLPPIPPTPTADLLDLNNNDQFPSLVNGRVFTGPASQVPTQMPGSFQQEPQQARQPGMASQGIDSPFENDLATPPPVRQRMTPDFHRIGGPAGHDYGAPMPGNPGINVGPSYVAPHNTYRSPAATFEVCRKKNDALKKFGGHIGEYAMWRDRILDHLCRSNRHWRHILETLQTCA